MPNENLSVTTTIPAPAEEVFAVLADPASHPAIDGTGWVVKPLDDTTLTGSGQTFRMAMYHQNHPDGSYRNQTCNTRHCIIDRRSDARL